MYLDINNGGYKTEISETDLRISKQALISDVGVPYMLTVRWSINGRKLNPGGSLTEMTKKLEKLDAAFNSGSGFLRSISLKYPNGSGDSFHTLNNDNTIGGIRVVSFPSFQEMKGAQYVTYHDYTIELEAMVPLLRDAILAEEEELTFEGGGPVFGHLETLNSDPVPQKLRRNSIYRATQSGRRVGFRSRPSIPPPLFPYAQVRAPRRSLRTPRYVGRDAIEYAVTWEYTFESAEPLHPPVTY